MYARRLRSSDGFIIFVVGIAVFTDMMLYGLIVPMLPYALSDRVGVAQKDVQGWNSILLGSFGGALMFGSCMFPFTSWESRHSYSLAFGAISVRLYSFLSR